MKIVTLCLACVAFINFTKVGAMNNDPGAGHNAIGVVVIQERPARRFRAADYPEIHPDIGAWANHNHSHPTRILSPVPNHPNRPQQQIRISRVVNGRTTDWHLLQGELVHDYEIISCHSPHGYAIIDIIPGERFYSCLKPFLYHNETKSRENASGPEVYLAFVIREGMYRLEADLAPRDERAALNSRGLLFHGEGVRNIFRMEPRGRVRYVLPNNTEVEGDLLQYPDAPEPRVRRNPRNT